MYKAEQNGDPKSERNVYNEKNEAHHNASKQ